MVARQFADAFGRQVRGTRQERHGDKASGPVLASVPAAAQMPDDDSGGEQLDRRLQTEAYQSDGRRDYPGVSESNRGSGRLFWPFGRAEDNIGPQDCDPL